MDIFKKIKPWKLYFSNDTLIDSKQKAILIRTFLIIIIFISSIFLTTDIASAVPSFARQTGLQCNECHTAYPQLTPFGREFKLRGYVMSDEKSKIPPVAFMALPSFTNTNEGQPGGATDDFDDNNNFAITQASIFYAGRLFGPYASMITGHEIGSFMNKIGTFVQTTWDGIEKKWAWDNAEVRFANSSTIDGKELDYGIYINNNPTMQDLWNTTPAWSFPFTGSGLAPMPAAATLLNDTIAQQVFGIGAYTRIMRTLYLEIGSYRTLGTGFQDAMGVDPAGEMQITDLAPYWRVAVEKDWGDNYLEVGTYGIYANIYPGRVSSAGKDHILDLGFDSQYQYISDVNDITARINFLHEFQDWNASRDLGNVSNSSDDLWNFTASTSYLYDKTYNASVQYFITGGDSDSILYADSRTGSPDSRGWVFELDYLPFNKSGGPKFWSKSNVKLTMQYVLYNKFDGSSDNYDGTGRDASDNNTLYLEAWVAF